MNKTIAAVFLCAWVALCAVGIVYFFDTPRQWTIKMLETKNTAEPALPPANISAAAILSSDAASQDSGIASTTLITYQYKLLDNVDPCTLNRLGALGWHAVQFGGTMTLSSGYEEQCKRVGIVDVLDWVLFEKPNNPNI